NYYKNSTENADQYHHYAKVLHSHAIGGLAYAQSYDDVFHQDASIEFNDGDEATITIMPF
ncbi:MAG: beta-1,3-glucanase family protein, partial [Lentisphaeria bacterium]|nr:beta-1,3-glucanase family protein [Lentisphaeria bacterium]